MGAALRIDAERLWAGPGRALERASVTVSGGEIVHVGPAAEAPEARAVKRVPFLAPGFVDRHVHVGLSSPREMLAGGVTRARDLAWPLAQIRPLARSSAKPGFPGPALEFCGPMLTAPGGYPTDREWAPPGTGEEVGSAASARAAVERILAAGAIAIKVGLNTNAAAVLGDLELAAVCEAAHERGRDVIAHAEGPGQVERALAAGVDELAHTPWTELLDAGLVADLARRCRIVSTLDMHLVNDDPASFELALENLTAFQAANGQVIYGTDLGNGPIPPGIHLEELRHLSRAGLSNEEILRASTAGRVLVGMRADLVGFAADPLRDLDAFGRLGLVVRAGTVRVEVGVGQ